jgi:uncharacterized protein
MTAWTIRGAVDAWINPNLGPPLREDWDVSGLFGSGLRDRLQEGTSLAQLVQQMDAAGVDRGVLCSGYSGETDLEWVRNAIKSHPDRFVGSHIVDPRKGMEAVREVESLVGGDGFRLIRMMGLQTQLPYDHPAYFPVYAKCAELGVPVGLNVGFPGPLVPSRSQDPLPIDAVAAFFPELTIVLSHGGEPWVDLCIKLMIKWSNVHYMTSAFAPKHIPAAVVDYANTRGADRIMFASDFPLLTHERCAREISAMPFRSQEIVDKFVAGNATRLFFDRQSR